MKKIFAILLSQLALSSLFAAQNTTLSIASVVANGLQVEVDGYLYQSAENSLIIQNLSSGYHSVIVHTNDFLNPKLLFNQQVELRDGVHTDITINRFGTAMKDERGVEGVGYLNLLPMSDYDFTRALETIGNEWRDEDREVVMRQIVDFNYFTTQQVINMLSHFSFDARRLSMAKYAYGKTLDRQNYYLVNNTFTYRSSKEQLADFIHNYR